MTLLLAFALPNNRWRLLDGAGPGQKGARPVAPAARRSALTAALEPG